MSFGFAFGFPRLVGRGGSDLLQYNLELEDGSNMLLEDGSYLLLEF
jgi:hypothetical protein